MKYKLIQTYPGYEILGETHCSENKTPEWKGTNFYDSHPKFWQKVEELDYEILSFKLISNGNLLIKHSNGLFGFSKGAYTKEDILSGDPKRIDFKTENTHDTYGYAINSVKRLSDGEVFTIGDKICFGNFGNKGFQPIDKIEIDYFDETRITAWNRAYGMGLEKWKKLPKKTPLFTTEEEKEIINLINQYK